MKIETKFEIGQEVYCVADCYNTLGARLEIVSIVRIYVIQISDKGIIYLTDDGQFEENELFATREEAEAKLRENKNESICN